MFWPPRITIRTLMIATAVCGVLVAAGVFTLKLRGAEMTSLVVVVIAAIGLLALRSRGPKRAFFWGFTLFAGIYAGVVLGNAQARLQMEAVNKFLVHLYERSNGAFNPTSPEEIVPMILRILDVLRVGHAWVALVVGFGGGLLCWATLYAIEEVRKFLRDNSPDRSK